MSYINTRRRLANVEAENLVAKIGSLTKVEPKAILMETAEGALMKYSYQFFNGELAFAPMLYEEGTDYYISIVAQGSNGITIVSEIPLGETIRIRFALLNKVCKAAGVIDFDKK